MPRPRTTLLTPQQTRVLRLYANGMNEQTIAKQLWLGVETVRSHRDRARRELRAKTIAHAVAIAYQQGILP